MGLHFAGCESRERCAGVVELVDAPDSKSGSVRSVGSIPTARTIQDGRLCKIHRTGDRSLHQRTPKGRTTRFPLREMTINRSGRNAFSAVWRHIAEKWQR